MKKIVTLTVIIISIIGCKKREPVCGSVACSCINIKNEQLLPVDDDSITIYNLISGTWYLRQEDNYSSLTDCKSSCYCNSHYTFVFLPNKTLIRSFPSGDTDTVSYNFVSLDDTTGIVNTTGTYFIPGDTVVLGAINYNSNYLYLTPANDYYTLFLYPHYPQYGYTLTRQ